MVVRRIVVLFLAEEKKYFSSPTRPLPFLGPPNPYSVGMTCAFPGNKPAAAWPLNTHLHLLPWLERVEIYHTTHYNSFLANTLYYLPFNHYIISHREFVCPVSLQSVIQQGKLRELLRWMELQCESYNIICLKVKVNFTLEQTTKAQRGSRVIALLFL